MNKPTLAHQKNTLFPKPNSDVNTSVLTPSDRYVKREKFSSIFGIPKFWAAKKWVHLIHNWRTGGSSLTALLSVNIHDSYLKVGHPFTRDGWPVDSLLPCRLQLRNYRNG